MAADPEKSPAEGPQVAAKPPRSYIAVTFLAFAIQIVNVSLFSCIGGLLDAAALPGGLVATVIAWWAWYKDRTPVGRVVGAFVTIFVTYYFVANIHNVLWSGHEALLR